MFTCPSSDIHSVYVDGELPAEFIPGYESHVASCEKCKAALSRMRAAHEFLSADAQSVTPDSHYMEQSWGRLMARRSYSRVSKKGAPLFGAESLKYALPAMAAAAVFALALALPSRASREKTQFVAQSSNPSINIGAMERRDGRLASMRQEPGAPFVQIEGSVGGAHAHGRPSFNSARRASAVGQAQSASFPSALDSVDVFRPDFAKSGNTVTIRITVPGITSSPVSADITLPAESLERDNLN